MMRVASLGMYDMPGIQDANDALWSGLAKWLRRNGLDGVPDRLDRGRPLDQILDDPNLLLAQTCGLPFATKWRGRLRYVATPCYAAPGCEGALYRSVIVVERGSPAQSLSDLRGAVAAVNETSSNSGYELLRRAVAPLSPLAPFFAEAVVTGSHQESVSAVAKGNAAVAAIDVVTFAHLGRHCPNLVAQVRSIGWTDLSPGLPFVTAGNAPRQLIGLLERALAWAAHSAELGSACETLLLRATSILPLGEYLTIGDGDGGKLSDPA
jgi:ABC-type phosphate/phosphonate transport system substrate-binding protein